MQEAIMPVNEEDRVGALHTYNILDTLPEKAYDDIVFIASSICDAPIALVSLVDSDGTIKLDLASMWHKHPATLLSAHMRSWSRKNC